MAKISTALGALLLTVSACVGTIIDDRDEGTGGAGSALVPPAAAVLVEAPAPAHDVFCEPLQGCDGGGQCVWDAGVMPDGGAAWICL